jgi:hypothetical protein
MCPQAYVDGSRLRDSPPKPPPLSRGSGSPPKQQLQSASPRAGPARRPSVGRMQCSAVTGMGALLRAARCQALPAAGDTWDGGGHGLDLPDCSSDGALWDAGAAALPPPPPATWLELQPVTWAGLQPFISHREAGPVARYELFAADQEQRRRRQPQEVSKQAMQQASQPLWQQELWCDEEEGEEEVSCGLGGGSGAEGGAVGREPAAEVSFAFACTLQGEQQQQAEDEEEESEEGAGGEETYQAGGRQQDEKQRQCEMATCAAADEAACSGLTAEARAEAAVAAEHQCTYATVAADNGSPGRAQTLERLRQRLGVSPARLRAAQQRRLLEDQQQQPRQQQCQEPGGPRRQRRHTEPAAALRPPAAPPLRGVLHSAPGGGKVCSASSASTGIQAARAGSLGDAALLILPEMGMEAPGAALEPALHQAGPHSPGPATAAATAVNPADAAAMMAGPSKCSSLPPQPAWLPPGSAGGPRPETLAAVKDDTIAGVGRVRALLDSIQMPAGLGGDAEDATLFPQLIAPAAPELSASNEEDEAQQTQQQRLAERLIRGLQQQQVVAPSSERDVGRTAAPGLQQPAAGPGQQLTEWREAGSSSASVGGGGAPLALSAEDAAGLLLLAPAAAASIAGAEPGAAAEGDAQAPGAAAPLHAVLCRLQPRSSGLDAEGGSAPPSARAALLAAVSSLMRRQAEAQRERRAELAQRLAQVSTHGARLSS